MPSETGTLVQLVIHYRYVMLFVLALVEGPVVMVLAGFLLHLGYFSLLPLYGTLMASDLTGDSRNGLPQSYPRKSPARSVEPETME